MTLDGQHSRLLLAASHQTPIRFSHFLFVTSFPFPASCVSNHFLLFLWVILWDDFEMSLETMQTLPRFLLGPQALQVMRSQDQIHCTLARGHRAASLQGMMLTPLCRNKAGHLECIARGVCCRGLSYLLWRSAFLNCVCFPFSSLFLSFWEGRAVYVLIECSSNIYYGLDVCVSPEFIGWNPNSQTHRARTLGLQKVISQWEWSFHEWD